MANPGFQGPALTTELARKFVWAGAAVGAVGVGLLAWSIGVEPGTLKGSRREESPRARP